LLDRSDVAAVDIVVPNDRHVEVATAALASGKDVLLEKPMAPTVEGCDRLLDAARRSGRVLSIGHEFRPSTQWGAIRRLVAAGELGHPLYALVSRVRRLAYACVAAPVVVTAFIVVVNRLTDGGPAFFNNPGAAWTHRFWFSLFGLMVVGLGLLLILPLRRCPHCGNGLFVSKMYRRPSATKLTGGGVNVFARRCVNCGLALGGR
jgi:hypothetical protein